MNKKGTLFYFTESFPYGLGEAWKTNELNGLRNSFEKIYVVPLWKANNNTPIAVSEGNIEVLEPALESPGEKWSWKDLLMLANASVLKELLQNNAFRHRNRIMKCLGYIKAAKRLIKSDTYRSVLLKSNKDTVWYFFWARGWADILPFISKPPVNKVAVKMHGYDLYMERNNGYIPFRSKLFDNADLLLAISENGKNYLQERYHQPQGKVLLSRLGTVGVGNSNAGSGSTLNIVSCFGIVGVKRMDRIIDSLRLITDIPIRWVHIGAGELMEEMKTRTASLPSNIEVNFLGKLTPAAVLEYYLRNETDLFINTSESEGVPVSIMEAFSAGIPVMATNVGGTAEIVDDSVGKLLPAKPEPSQIAAAIKEFYRLPVAEKKALRQRATQRYAERCDAREWAKHLQQILQINS